MWLIHADPLVAPKLQLSFFCPTPSNFTHQHQPISTYINHKRQGMTSARVAWGKRHLVEFTLYNQGEVPATARFELTAKSSFSLSLSEEDYTGAKGGQHGSTQDVSREPSDFSQRLAQVEWIWMRTCHNWSLFGRWWIGRWCSYLFCCRKVWIGGSLGGLPSVTSIHCH